jgi:hypothetical protein
LKLRVFNAVAYEELGFLLLVFFRFYFFDISPVLLVVLSVFG